MHSSRHSNSSPPKSNKKRLRGKGRTKKSKKKKAPVASGIVAKSSLAGATAGASGDAEFNFATNGLQKTGGPGAAELNFAAPSANTGAAELSFAATSANTGAAELNFAASSFELFDGLDDSQNNNTVNNDDYNYDDFVASTDEFPGNFFSFGFDFVSSESQAEDPVPDVEALLRHFPMPDREEVSDLPPDRNLFHPELARNKPKHSLVFVDQPTFGPSFAPMFSPRLVFDLPWSHIEDTRQFDSYAIRSGVLQRADSFTPCSPTSVYVVNQLHRRRHYSCLDDATFEGLCEQYRQAKVPLHDHSQGTLESPVKSSHDSSDFLWFSSPHDSTTNALVHALQLPKLARELFFYQPGYAPSKEKNRGSRQMSFGFENNTALRGKNGDMAAPSLLPATQFLTKLFVKATELLQHASSIGQFNIPTINGDRYAQFAAKIDPANLLEFATVVVYLHDYPTRPSTCDILSPHTDKNNDYTNDNDVCIAAEETYFEHQVGRWVTVKVVGGWRRSVLDYLRRLSVIDAVAEEFVGFYNSCPLSQQVVTPESLCPATFDMIEKPVHMEGILAHASPLFHWLRLLNQRFMSLHNRALTRAFAVDVVYAFFWTNNVYRFHKFMKRLHGSLSSLQLGKQSVTVAFRRWLLIEYGATCGTKACASLRQTIPDAVEGVERYQAAANNPILEAVTSASLEYLVSITLGNGHFRDSEAAFLRLEKEISKKVIGLGDLLVPKMIHCFCVLQLLPNYFLKYCPPGTKKHLERIKAHHPNFDRPEHVKQLLRRISKRLGCEMIKAEEILCCGSKSLYVVSETRFTGIAIGGVEMYFLQSEVDANGAKLAPSIHMLQPGDTQSVPMWMVNWSQDDPSFSPWLKREEWLYNVLLASTGQLIAKHRKQAIIPKKEPAKKNPVTAPSLSATRPSNAVIQTLLTKGKYRVVLEPLTFLARVFLVEVEELRSAITRSKVQGYYYSMLQLTGNSFSIDSQEALSQCPVEQQFPGGICVGDKTVYKDPFIADLALIANLLFNVSISATRHWGERVLDNVVGDNATESEKEYLLLFPATPAKEVCIIVAGLMLRGDWLTARLFDSKTGLFMKEFRLSPRWSDSREQPL